MKVIYDISALSQSRYIKGNRGGVARLIECLAEELISNDDIEMVLSGFNGIDNHVQTRKYCRSSFIGKNFSLCGAEGRFPSMALKLMEQIYPAPDPEHFAYYCGRSLNYLYRNLDFLWKGLDRKVSNAADIFHSTFFPLPDYLDSRHGPKRFLTVYDLIPIMAPHFFKFNNERVLQSILRSIRPDDSIIAISESTRIDLCSISGIDPARVTVIPLGASDLFYQCQDPDRIAAVMQRYGIPDEPYVLSLCTLEPRKNIDHAIRCFVRLVEEQKISDLNLVLVGEKGWNYEQIFKEISATSTRCRVLTTGFVPDEDIAALYSGARMFVYPSFYEGFGLPPLEAMKCGVPVITSNSSSLPEVVGDAGVMVDPNDCDALCQAMYEIYTDPVVYERMSARSLVQAEKFSWKKCAEKTVSAYNAALQE